MEGILGNLRVLKISDWRCSGVSTSHILEEDEVRKGTPLVGGGENDIAAESVDD